MITRGFKSKRPRGDPTRVPPGQYVTNDFPVLSAGPTPQAALEAWSFVLRDVDERELASWNWKDLLSLPSTVMTVDIHCVTKWSKLDTRWKGVTIDDLLEAADVDPPAAYVTAFSDGGYTTNLAVEDLLGGRGMIAYEYDGAPIEAEHGGPARLLVPHLYFWKSAKWVRGLQFMEDNEPGFWETHGYHLRGDPWKEERYAGD
ncbi:MAG TPA: sulfite oxidase-like oxidoreductase [Myxococcaceae bacterium]|nr:sulfite oxidase-like oxidoreductase [Myxococcaceae bacterium]